MNRTKPPIPADRDGFVLILVLAMLALIAILGVGFANWSGGQKIGAEARDQAVQNKISVDDLLDQGMAAVLCGNGNSSSFTGGHEICRDLYGNDGQKAVLVAGQAGATPGTTLLRLRADVTAKPLYDLMPLAGFYNGRLLVLTSGGLKGRSLRILGSVVAQVGPPVVLDVQVDAALNLTQLAPGDQVVLVARPFNGSGAGVYSFPVGPGFVDLNGDGRPDDTASDANGDGVADAPDGLPDLFTPNLFFAGLKPEMVWQPDPTILPAMGRYVPVGGYDEDYDYPDFQNMFLALVHYPDLTVNPNGRPIVELPSFHRAGMMQKVRSVGIPAYGVPAFEPWLDPRGRKMILRPRPIDQRLPGPDGMLGTADDIPGPGPDNLYGTGDDVAFPMPKFLYRVNPAGQQLLFDPSNPNDANGDGFINQADLQYVLQNNAVAVDVDNDADGVPDSIWVDIGYPVQTSADGRRYKPLFAYLILPMDGKLNLNAHGKLDEDRFANRTADWDGDGLRDLAMIDANGNNIVDPVADPGDRDVANAPNVPLMDSHLATAPGPDGILGTLDDVPVGSGWSVSEINLQRIFATRHPDLRDNDGNGTVDDPGEIRMLGDYMRVLEGRVGDPSQPLARPLVAGRWGEPYLLLDQNNDGYPDAAAGVYPRAGATAGSPLNLNPDDDRPGDLFTRLLIGGSNGIDDDGDGTVDELGELAAASGDFLKGSFQLGAGGAFPIWYRNPADFDGDGNLGMYPYNALNALDPLNRFFGKGWPVFGPNPTTTMPWVLPWAGWGGTVAASPQYGWPVVAAIPGMTPGWNTGENVIGLGENIDEADEMNLATTLGVDANYGPEDLAWLYLIHDVGPYQLKSRLEELAPFTLGNSRLLQNTSWGTTFHNRHLLTTDSWDLTSYNMPPGGSTATGASIDTIPFQSSTNLPFIPGQGSGSLAAALTLSRPNLFALLPEEIKAGRRLDLNRPFGDGLDNNNNGVVDEDLEAGIDGIDNDGDGQVDETVAQVSAGPGYPNGIDDDGDGQVDEADELIENVLGPNNTDHDFDDVPGPRQRLARDLYVLLYLLTPVNVGADGQWGTADDVPGFTLPPGFTQDAAGRADFLAQLAVNIVDFRDADKDSTGFEYDRFLGLDATGNPTGTNSLVPVWNVDGNLTTDENVGALVAQRGVVWGVERPDVIVNETLAYYDTMNEEEMNQNLAPDALDESHLWVELYDPNDPNHPGYPPVDLSALVPASAPLNQQTELWRLVISAPTGDPTNNTLPGAPLPPALDGEAPMASTLVQVQKVIFRQGAAVGIDNQPMAPTTPTDPNGAMSSSTVALPVLLNGDGYLEVGSITTTPPEFPNGTPVPDVLIDRNVNTPAGLWLNTGLTSTSLTGNTPQRLGAYLQRLADPTRTWDINANPYITVDALEVKVHVIDSTNQDPMTMMPILEPVYSYERLMPYVGRNRDAANVPPDPQGGQDYQLGAVQGGHSMPDATPQPGLDPKTNERTRTAGPPTMPFPWFAFNDRPFATPMELLLVPATRPGRLTNEFSTNDASSGTVNPYQPLANATLPVVDPARPPDHFPHLAQFFEDNRKPANLPQAAPGLYRLLEFVEVPSPNNGISELLNPQVNPPPLHFRRGQRVPGKINLNAVFEQEVFEALLNTDPSVPSNPMNALAQALWQAFNGTAQDVRKGQDNLWGTDDDRPYRSLAFGQPLGDIDDTLLRNNQPIPPGGPAGNVPLFDLQTVMAGQQPGDPNPQHSALRYQLLQKLGNTTTTRSNVFAVWVTVGFFEVLNEPKPDGVDDDGDGVDTNGDGVIGAGDFNVDEPDELLPRLGRELGWDTGKVERHRAFYIIDRSRSKGWHPDAAIDAGPMMLFRRVIE